MKGKIYDSFSEAYLDVLRDVFFNYEHEIKYEDTDAGKGKKINKSDTVEKMNYSFTIKEPKDYYPLTLSEERNKTIRGYIDRELILFDYGDNNATGNMSNISSIWKVISNPDGTINSNYGLMVYHIKDAGNKKYSEEEPTNQWEWAKDRLVKDKHGLQAYLHFNRPIHQWKENLDQPCTVFIQFYIRNDKLHLVSYMRSNDLVYGTPYNISYFIRLLHRMLYELKPNYPELTLGNYIHNATSLHIYKRNFDKVRQMLGIN